MITEDQLDVKYAPGVPWWRKAPIERFICNKHKEPTIFIRDIDKYVHANVETECT